MKMEMKEDNKWHRNSGTEGEQNSEMKVTVSRSSYVQSALRRGPRVSVHVLQFILSFYLHLTNVLFVRPSSGQHYDGVLYRIPST
jgi:hypothetical protein